MSNCPNEQIIELISRIIMLDDSTIPECDFFLPLNDQLCWVDPRLGLPGGPSIEGPQVVGTLEDVGGDGGTMLGLLHIDTHTILTFTLEGLTKNGI